MARMGTRTALVKTWPVPWPWSPPAHDIANARAVITAPRTRIRPVWPNPAGVEGQSVLDAIAVFHVWMGCANLGVVPHCCQRSTTPR